ncbi:MAG: hypothetical protein QE263_02470 [Vampirovibrionales bacterium]|nr:hypothetical protein [Vampirovibrionales bacterium]
MLKFSHSPLPQFSGIYRFRSWEQVKPLLFESGHLTGRWKDSSLQAVRAALKKAGLESELLQPFGWLHPQGHHKGHKEFVFATNDHYGHHAHEWQTLFRTNAIQLDRQQQHWGRNPNGWLELPHGAQSIQTLVLKPVHHVWHWLKSLWLQVF